MGTVRLVKRNYSYRWEVANLSSEITATDGDWKTCPAKI